MMRKNRKYNLSTEQKITLHELSADRFLQELCSSEQEERMGFGSDYEESRETERSRVRAIRRI